MELSLPDKKIAIVGLGVNNRKLAEFFDRQEIKYTVIENWKDPQELVGKLDDFDIVVRTPGLPFFSPAIQQALNKGVEITSQTKLFFKLCPAQIIGVTGTKGKGTTSSLIARILETAGKKVWLGGNIGTDPFEFLEKIEERDWVVLELSSFQLQDMDQSPDIAVVLNITSDHLTYHKSLEEYVKAKSNIVAFQDSRDIAILDPRLPEEFKALGSAQKIYFDTTVVKDMPTLLLGEHNLENIAAAVAVAKVLKIDEHIISKAVGEFEPLDHRLKLIRNVGGVHYIDDAYSTNIDPAIAAMRAVNLNTVLIVGGFDKGLDFTTLGAEIKDSEYVKAVVVYGQVTEKILKAMEGYGGKVLTGAKNMQEILSQAQSVASAGDTILFSPATSSFDLFKNETDRGEQFVKAVMDLK